MLGGHFHKGGEVYQQPREEYDAGWNYVKGKKGKLWGKPQGKDGGHGKGGKGFPWNKGGKGKRPSRRVQLPWADSYMDARSSLHQFLRLHENFLFRPQPNVPVSLQPTFTLLAEEGPLLAEEGPNLYKNVRRHCQDGADGDELASDHQASGQDHALGC